MHKLLFLVIIFALLTVPLIKFDLHGTLDYLENKQLTKYPSLREIRDRPFKVSIEQFEDFFQGRVGFRTEMRKLYNGFFYYCLRISAGKMSAGGGSIHYSNNLMVGREGMIFRSASLLPEIYTPLDDKKTDLSISEFTELKSLADKFGVPTRAVIIPQKTLLEAAYLPYYIRKFMFTPPPPPPTYHIY